MSDDIKRLCDSIRSMQKELEERFCRLLEKLVEKIIGIRVKVVFEVFETDLFLEGYKDEVSNTIVLDYEMLKTSGEYLLPVLFHEACHNIVSEQYFHNDYQAHRNVYLSYEDPYENPEEVLCQTFAFDLLRALPLSLVMDVRFIMKGIWFIKCKYDEVSKIAPKLLHYKGAEEALHHVKESIEVCETIYNKTLAKIEELSKKIDEEKLPVVDDKMIKEMMRFLKRHNYY